MSASPAAKAVAIFPAPMNPTLRFLTVAAKGRDAIFLLTWGGGLQLVSANTVFYITGCYFVMCDLFLVFVSSLNRQLRVDRKF